MQLERERFSESHADWEAPKAPQEKDKKEHAKDSFQESINSGLLDNAYENLVEASKTEIDSESFEKMKSSLLKALDHTISTSSEQVSADLKKSLKNIRSAVESDTYDAIEEIENNPEIAFNQALESGNADDAFRKLTQLNREGAPKEKIAEYKKQFLEYINSYIDNTSDEEDFEGNLQAIQMRSLVERDLYQPEVIFGDEELPMAEEVFDEESSDTVEIPEAEIADTQEIMAEDIPTDQIVIELQQQLEKSREKDSVVFTGDEKTIASFTGEEPTEITPPPNNLIDLDSRRPTVEDAKPNKNDKFKARMGRVYLERAIANLEDQSTDIDKAYQNIIFLLRGEKAKSVTMDKESLDMIQELLKLKITEELKDESILASTKEHYMQMLTQLDSGDLRLANLFPELVKPKIEYTPEEVMEKMDKIALDSSANLVLTNLNGGNPFAAYDQLTKMYRNGAAGQEGFEEVKKEFIAATENMANDNAKFTDKQREIISIMSYLVEQDRFEPETLADNYIPPIEAAN